MFSILCKDTICSVIIQNIVWEYLLCDFPLVFFPLQDATVEIVNVIAFCGKDLGCLCTTSSATAIHR